jgi:hypothetical protein
MAAHGTTSGQDEAGAAAIRARTDLKEARDTGLLYGLRLASRQTLGFRSDTGYPKLALNPRRGQQMVCRTQELLLLLTVGVTLTGCISDIPMTRDAANAIANREVTVARREKPDFVAATTGRALGGLFLPAGMGMALMTSAGNELVAKNNIEDPAGYIGERMSHALAAKYGITVSSRSIALSDDVVQAILKNNPGVDLVLDVGTTEWRFFSPPGSDMYHVGYVVRLRLIDAKGGSVIAEGGCKAVSGPTPPGELVANGAERLKKDLRAAADGCVALFKTTIFQN